MNDLSMSSLTIALRPDEMAVLHDAARATGSRPEELAPAIIKLWLYQYAKEQARLSQNATVAQWMLNQRLQGSQT